MVSAVGTKNLRGFGPRPAFSSRLFERPGSFSVPGIPEAGLRATNAAELYSIEPGYPATQFVIQPKPFALMTVYSLWHDH